MHWTSTTTTPQLGSSESRYADKTQESGSQKQVWPISLPSAARSSSLPGMASHTVAANQGETKMGCLGLHCAENRPLARGKRRPGCPLDVSLPGGGLCPLQVSAAGS